MNRKMNRVARSGSSRALSRFAKDEDGHIVVFTVIMMTLMLALAGIGVDVIQFETARTKQQQTLDRATLAAASLSQELNAESVVRDYFAKADLADKLTLVQFQRTFNASTVRAEAETELTPIFLNLYDLSDSTRLIARGASQAEQRINNIEIMLVLDVSGSMSGTKLRNLKTSASEFIDTVLEQDIENRVSIGIVPYNGQVNLPQYMQNLFTSVDDHGVQNVNCFDLPASTYNSLTLSRTTGLPVTAHADTFSSTTTGYVEPNDGNAVPNPANRWCPPSTRNTVRAPTNNATALKSHINGLEAVGATSINAGMKWAMALLDPAARSLYTGFVAAGQTPAYFGDRPFAYGAEDSMKIVVLMTDGEHFAEERVNEGFRSGDSPIFRHTDGRYSIYHNVSGNNKYYVPHENAWQRNPWGGNSAVRQTWPQLWANLRVAYVAWQFYARPSGNSTSFYNSTMNSFRTLTPVNTMNSQLQSVCTQAKSRQVMVYGIAFEAPSNGRDMIEGCASSPAHYFNAQGLEIQTAFRAIATNISQLKLTQ